MTIQIALVVNAPREMILTAGRQEIEPSKQLEPEKEDHPFLKIGRAESDEMHLSGALVGDPEDLGASLSLGWFLPDEEDVNLAQPIDLSPAKVIISTTSRHKAEAGWRWHYRLESRKPYQEIKFYGGGFQPPFRASDLTIYLDHLINYNYDGYIISRIDYIYKAPSYIESEWSVPVLESEGFLED